jgi:hypothetical protein
MKTIPHRSSFCAKLYTVEGKARYRRCIMASVMNIKESKGFCDEVYTQLTDMKNKILELQERSVAVSPGKDVEGGMFGRHLCELAEQIDWKLQILSHSCSVDWKGAADYEETAQVAMTEKSKELEFSPGYIGG